MTDSFSGVLLDIVEIAGSEAAEAFEKAFGGRRLYIPSARNLRPDHAIAKAVGYAAALKIADYFSTEQTGSEVNVPLGNAGDQQKLKNALFECVEAGLVEGRSTSNVAAKCGCTTRNVQRIKTRLIEAGIIADKRPIAASNPIVFAQIATRKAIAQDLKALRSIDMGALKLIAANHSCSLDVVQEVFRGLRMGGLVPNLKSTRGG